ncbi:MAG: hypothetical protein PVG86_09275 [Desulfobacterales bacterium]
MIENERERRRGSKDAAYGWTLESISKIGFWLKVKAGPSFNPPRKHHGISDRHTKVCRGLETRT